MIAPWDDAQLMKQVRADIKEFGSTFKPVRSVRKTAKHGETFLALTFEDGLPLDGGAAEFNRFHSYARAQWPTVPISIKTEVTAT